MIRENWTNDMRKCKRKIEARDRERLWKKINTNNKKNGYREIGLISEKLFYEIIYAHVVRDVWEGRVDAELFTFTWMMVLSSFRPQSN